MSEHKDFGAMLDALYNDRANYTIVAQFYSMTEQWMKFASLILHPGLITPSSEERCMVVAYTMPNSTADVCHGRLEPSLPTKLTPSVLSDGTTYPMGSCRVHCASSR